MSISSEIRLERNLALYTLAAAATLAAGHPAQAEVVFTPSSRQFTGIPIDIDMDNDGVADFTMRGTGGCNSTYSFCAFSYGVIRATNAPRRNGVAQENIGSFPFEAALIRGNHIGRPVDRFNGSLMYFKGTTGSGGPWQNVTDRYLGVKLIIDGQVHYGWIGFKQTRSHLTLFQAQFTGWAYETEPNTPIRAGQRTGTAASPMTMDSESNASLELRAAGHVGQAALIKRSGAR